MIDKVKTLSKAEFRRVVETRVKNFLGHKYVDFDNIGHIHLFEQMKKAIGCNSIFNQQPKLNQNKQTDEFLNLSVKSIYDIRDSLDKFDILRKPFKIKRGRKFKRLKFHKIDDKISGKKNKKNNVEFHHKYEYLNNSAVTDTDDINLNELDTRERIIRLINDYVNYIFNNSQIIKVKFPTIFYLNWLLKYKWS